MKLHVLIVEDNAVQLEVLADLFQSREDIEVQTCLSASEAIELCSFFTFDLVVTDLQMPEMDGIQFIQGLASRPPTPPLALISASDGRMLTSAGLAAESLGVQVVGVLQKPATDAQIAEVLDELRTLRRPPAAAIKPASAAIEESVLKQALALGGVSAWFQPKVSTRTHQVVAAEALARWQTGRGEHISPGQFLPAVVQFGLEKELLHTMLISSIDAQRGWQRMGRRISVSVNLPTHMLDDPSLADELLDLTLSSGGEPTLLCFELLEDSTTPHIGDYYAGACRLRLKGFGLAQDDFGRGISSVHNLISTPFTEVKIDRALVDGCSRDPTLQATLSTLIPLAGKLGLICVAEGVETAEDFGFLCDLGCDLVQGFLFSPAIPAHDFGLQVLHRKY